MTGDTRCGGCGAKARDEWAQCVRCGLPLAGPAEPSHPAAWRWVTVAGIAACLVAGGAVMMLPGPHASPGPGPAGASNVHGGAAAARPAAVAARPDGQVDPAFASRDASTAALVAYRGGDVDAAIAQFTHAIDVDPRNAEALNNLGQVLVRAGRAREALPYFDRAVAISDSTWAYHFNQARAHGELQEWSAAVDGYRRAAELFPDDYVTQFNLARALQASGDVAAAVTTYERAIALAPGQADFHLSYGLALEAAGRPADAAAAYRRYLELEPGARDAGAIKARIAALAAR